MYIDQLGDIVNKYNNTYDDKIKLKRIDIKCSIYLDSKKKVIIKILNW